MVRLLFLLQAVGYGGVEMALYDLLSGLNEQEFHATVYVYYPGGELEPAFQELCEKKGFCMARMFPDVKPERSLIGKLKNHYLLNMVEPAKFTRPRRFYRHAIKGTYDIEVAFSFAGAPLIIGASPNRKSKKVAWIHGDMKQNGWCLRHYKNLKQQSDNYRQFDKIICVSNTVKQAFYEMMGDVPNVTVLNNPVNTDKIRTLSKEPLPPEIANFVDENTLCTVGRISAEKGYERLLHIHRQLLDEGGFHKLIIVGDGPDREKLERLLDQLCLRDTVKIMGFDSNPYRYMSKARFFVCSSFTEGLPVVAQETLILERPIVSSHPSVGELFQGKQCGIISGMDDDSLKDALRKMLTDEDFYQHCLDEAHEVGSTIQQKTMVEAIEQMFRDVLK